MSAVAIAPAGGLLATGGDATVLSPVKASDSCRFDRLMPAKWCVLYRC